MTPARLGALARIASLGALIGLGLVTAVIVARADDWLVPFLMKNQLDAHRRMAILWWEAAGALGGALVALVSVFVLRRRDGSQEKILSALWFLSPLMLLSAGWLLFRAGAWVNRQVVLLSLALSVSLALEVLGFHSLSNIPRALTDRFAKLQRATPEFLRRHGPLLVVCLATVAFTAFMAFYNIRWHYKLKTHNFDLSIDNNLIYSALHGHHMESTVTNGNEPGAYMAVHAKLGQYVILPLYALYPKPEMLIVIQALLLGLGALPLFGFARRHVSDRMAALIALAYLAYHPIHCQNFVESKYLSLSGFFVLSVFWAAERKKWVLFGLAFVAASLMREDIPVGLAVGGTFLLLTGYRPAAGALMAVVSLGWFLVLRKIQASTGDWWFPGMYKGLWAQGQTGYVSVVKTVVTNPLFVLSKLFDQDKVVYLLHLFVPLSFLPARRWYLWAAFIPGTVLTLFVTDYKPIFGYSFQYAMHWIPYLFLVLPLALEAITRQQGMLKARAAACGMVLATTATSYNYGAFARRPNSVRGGYFAIDFTFSEAERHRYRDLRALIAEIPPRASVVATENTGPHVSSRVRMYALRRGVYDAEYMLAARQELDFEQTRRLFTDAVKKGTYGVVDRKGDFVLLKKGNPTTANAQLVRDWQL